MVALDNQFLCLDKWQLELADVTAAKLGKIAKLHLRIDTGVGREGLFAEQAVAFAQQAKHYTHIQMIGVTSHFYLADGTDSVDVDYQFADFQRALSELTSAGLRPRIAHLAISPAPLRYPLTRLDMIRCSIQHITESPAQLHRVKSLLGYNSMLD